MFKWLENEFELIIQVDKVVDKFLPTLYYGTQVCKL